MTRCITLVVMLVSISVFGNETDTANRHKIESRIGIQLEGDYVTSSYRDEMRTPILPENMIYARSGLSPSLKYSFSFKNPGIRNFYPGGYQGIGISMLSLGIERYGKSPSTTSLIGLPVIAYIFQGGPITYLKRNLSLDYEWNFGASFGWRPLSMVNDNYNLTVGSRVNAYLNIDLLVKWRLSSRVDLYGGISLSHFSNGNTSNPNPGVNMAGLRVGFNYLLGKEKPETLSSTPDSNDFENKRGVAYDIMMWGAWRKRVYKGGERPVLLNGHFACAGISFSPMWETSRWVKAGGALDIQWDESSDLKNNYISGASSDDIRFKRPKFIRQVSWGISAHGELCMPIFSLNIGCGYNLYAPRENRGTYQNISLKTYLGNKFFINVGYQLRNFHQQSSLMLGCGVTL